MASPPDFIYAVLFLLFSGAAVIMIIAMLKAFLLGKDRIPELRANANKQVQKDKNSMFDAECAFEDLQDAVDVDELIKNVQPFIAKYGVQDIFATVEKKLKEAGVLMQDLKSELVKKKGVRLSFVNEDKDD